MDPVTLTLLFFLPFLADRVTDPSPGFFHSKEEARSVECVRLSLAEAHAREPARVPDVHPREARSITDALVCKRLYLAPGERDPRDEAILSTLRREVGEIVQVAAATGDPETLWLVDAFYPEAIIARKIAVAARTELAERGLRVSDRVPVLAAGDLSVLGTLEPRDAYSLACARAFAEGALAAPEAFLGVMIVDAREAQLHAGVCEQGHWRWLR